MDINEDVSRKAHNPTIKGKKAIKEKQRKQRENPATQANKLPVYRSSRKLLANIQYKADKIQRYTKSSVINRQATLPPPDIVVVFGGHKSGKSTLIRQLVRGYAHRKLKETAGCITVVVSKKKRVTFYESPQDLPSVLDLCKVVDLAIFMVDARIGLEMDLFETLNCLQLHGFPKVAFVLTHLDSIEKLSQRRKYEKMMKARFEREVGGASKVFAMEELKYGEYPRSEVIKLARIISQFNYFPLKWRNSHPFFLIDRIEAVNDPDKEMKALAGLFSGQANEDKNKDEGKEVKLYGYMRGTYVNIPFDNRVSRTRMRVYIPGMGDFYTKEITLLKDPCPLISDSDKYKKMQGAIASLEMPGKNTSNSSIKLREKDRFLYAPYSDDSLIFDGSNTYIKVDTSKTTSNYGSTQYNTSSLARQDIGNMVDNIVKKQGLSSADTEESNIVPKINLFGDTYDLDPKEYEITYNDDKIESDKKARRVFEENENLEKNDNDEDNDNEKANEYQDESSDSNLDGIDLNDFNINDDGDFLLQEDEEDNNITVNDSENMNENLEDNSNDSTEGDINEYDADEEEENENENENEEEEEEKISKKREQREQINDKETSETMSDDMDNMDNNSSTEKNIDDKEVSRKKGKVERNISLNDNIGISTFSYSDLIYAKKDIDKNSTSTSTSNTNANLYTQQSTGTDKYTMQVDDFLSGKFKNSREAARFVKNPLLAQSLNNKDKVPRFVPITKTPYCLFENHSELDDNTRQFIRNYDLQKNTLTIPQDGYKFNVEKIYDPKNIKELFATGSLLWDIAEEEEEVSENDNEDNNGNGKKLSRKDRVKKEMESLEFDDSYEREQLEKAKKISELNESSQAGNTNSISPGQYVCLTLTLPIVPELWVQKKKYKTKNLQYNEEMGGTFNKNGNNEFKDLNESNMDSESGIYAEEDEEEEEENYEEEEEEEEENQEVDSSDKISDDELDKSDSQENIDKNYNLTKEEENYDRENDIQNNNMQISGNNYSNDLNKQNKDEQDPNAEYKIVFDNTPLLVCVDTNNEHTNMFLNCRIKRHRWYKGLLKSNDPLIISCGWRRYQSIPIYSMKDTTSAAMTKNIAENLNTNTALGGLRYRMLKYTPEHLHCIMTTFGYSVPPNSGIMAFNTLGDTRNFRVCATGTVLEATTKPKITKKLKLVGYPKEVKNKTAIIEKMFHSKAEALLFVNSKIRTVSGIRGIIKKANKDGTVRCSFEDKVLKSDIVFIRGFVPVKLHKYVNHVINHLIPLKRWPHLRRIVEIRAAEGIKIETNPDSIYQTEAKRKTHTVETIRIPEKILNSLPFKSRQKVHEMVKKPRTYTLLKPGEAADKRLESHLFILSQHERRKREIKNQHRQNKLRRAQRLENAKAAEAHKNKMKERMRKNGGRGNNKT